MGENLLVNRLCATLESKRQGRFPKLSAIGNKRAEKEIRRVEISWKASDVCGNLRQVPAKSGGGTCRQTLSDVRPVANCN